MGTQISLKLSDTMIKKARKEAKTLGYDTIQDFIRETLRRRLFEEEQISGKLTYLASEQSLAKHWLDAKEELAWKHLQKEK